MARSRALENRRHEPRHYLPRTPIAWRKHGTEPWHRGWLHDVSASGASLLVPTEALPQTGHEIDLRRRYRGEILLCRVARTQICEDGQGLVACRVVSANGCSALLRPAPNAGTAREQALRRAWPPELWIHSPHDMACRRSA